MSEKKCSLYISPIVLIMFALLIFLGYFFECIVYLVTVVLHELAHAHIATKLGYSLSSFKLMPYGASLTGEFEGANWEDEAIIAIAGPLCNLIIAVTITSLWWVAPVTYIFFSEFVSANIFTALFNMLPVFPLDGGRFLLALLSKNHTRSVVYKKLRIVGYVFAVIFAIVFAITAILGVINFSFVMISIFILVSTILPDKNSSYRRLYGMAFFSERLKHGLRVNKIMISGKTELSRLSRLLNENYYTVFSVCDDNYCIIGEVDEQKLEELLKKYEHTVSVEKAFKDI